MLFPERMMRVEIFLEEDHLYSELEAIGKTGLLHIDRRNSRPLFYRQYDRAEKLLTLVEGYLSFLKLGPGHKTVAVSVDSAGEILAGIETDISSVAPEINRLANAENALEQEENLLHGAEDFCRAFREETDPEHLAETLGFVAFKAVTLPSDRIETLMIALKRYDPLILYAPLTQGSAAVILLYDPDLEPHMKTAISKLEGTELPRRYFLPQTRENAKKEREKLRKLFAETAARYGTLLQTYHAQLRHLVGIFGAQSALEEHESGYRLSGWIPRRETERFRNALKHAQIRFSPAGDDAPVRLSTPGIFRPFETMIRGFSYPAYNEINPTVPFAVAFIVMFGAMFGDVGHGLVLMLLGAGVRQYRKSYRDLGNIYILAGGGSVLFGFFYGSVFGMHHWISPLFFSPEERVDLSIYTGIAIGIFFITFSFLLNIYSLSKRRAFGSLLWGEGGILWLLIYWLAIGTLVKSLVFRLPVSLELSLLGGMILPAVILPIFRKGDPFQNFLAMLIRIFEYAVNTISFARLGAFALAHGALFLALFSVADILSNTPESRGIGYWFILVLGNLFIIGLEGVVVTIQTLRLEYYEFFKRFFRGGGRPYTPYRLENEG